VVQNWESNIAASLCESVDATAGAAAAVPALKVSYRLCDESPRAHGYAPFCPSPCFFLYSDLDGACMFVKVEARSVRI